MKTGWKSIIYNREGLMLVLANTCAIFYSYFIGSKFQSWVKPLEADLGLAPNQHNQRFFHGFNPALKFLLIDFSRILNISPQ